VAEAGRSPYFFFFFQVDEAFLFYTPDARRVIEAERWRQKKAGEQGSAAAWQQQLQRARER